MEIKEDGNFQDAYTKAKENLSAQMKYYIAGIASVGINSARDAEILQARAKGILKAIHEKGADPDDYLQIFVGKL